MNTGTKCQINISLIHQPWTMFIVYTASSCSSFINTCIHVQSCTTINCKTRWVCGPSSVINRVAKKYVCKAACVLNVKLQTSISSHPHHHLSINVGVHALHLYTCACASFIQHWFRGVGRVVYITKCPNNFTHDCSCKFCMLHKCTCMLFRLQGTKCTSYTRPQINKHTSLEMKYIHKALICQKEW